MSDGAPARAGRACQCSDGAHDAMHCQAATAIRFIGTVVHDNGVYLFPRWQTPEFPCCAPGTQNGADPTDLELLNAPGSDFVVSRNPIFRRDSAPTVLRCGTSVVLHVPVQTQGRVGTFMEAYAVHPDTAELRIGVVALEGCCDGEQDWRRFLGCFRV
jgi:hypothetical protein